MTPDTPQAPDTLIVRSDAAARPIDDLITRATLPITLLVQAAASAAIIAPAIAAPRLLETMHLGTVAVGVFAALVYLAAMLSSQWGAVLVQRWGPIRTSQVALGSCALGLLAVASANLPMAVAGTLLLGIGYGPITPASSDMLARTTRPERFALVFSVKQTGVPLGGAVAGLLVPVVLTHYGTGAALAQISGLCVLGMALAAVLRNRLDSLRKPHAPLPSLQHTLRPIRLVLAHRVLRQLALCTLVFSAVQLSLTSYLVSFLHGDLQWSLIAAGAALSAAQMGGVVGRIAWGVLADHLHDGARRTLLGLACGMAVCGLTMLALGASIAHSAVLALVVVYGATGIGWNGVFLGTVARAVPRAQAGMATAGCLFFTYFGVVIGPPLFGAASDWAGRLAISFALLALPLAWAIGTLAWSRWSDPVEAA